MMVPVGVPERWLGSVPLGDVELFRRQYLLDLLGRRAVPPPGVPGSRALPFVRSGRRDPGRDRIAARMTGARECRDQDRGAKERGGANVANDGFSKGGP